MNSGINDADRCNAIVLNTDDPVDNEILAQLRADPRIEFVDNVSQQQAGLQELRPPPHPTSLPSPLGGLTIHGAWRWSAFWALAHFDCCDLTETEI